MNYPSVKRISERLNVEKAIAKQVRGVMDGSIDPVTVGTKASEYVKSCFIRDPGEDIVKLYAIDELIEACGAEGFNSIQGAAEYCNTGHSYNPTVLYFSHSRRFRIGCHGDYVKPSKN